MSTTATDLEIFTDAPAPVPRRPRVLLIGTLFTGSAAAAAIAAMVALYVQVRADHLATNPTWLPDEALLELTPGNVAFVTLLMSVVTAAAAVDCLRWDDRPHGYLALGTTLLLGVAFITVTAFLWQQLNLGISETRQAILIYTISGAHVVMAGAGLIYLLVMGFRALGGQLTGRAAEGFNAAAVFWYLTVAVYGLVWYAIYITK
jgi:heme/copper-type cytochrome/quinol oxidase subunit 3